MSTKERAIIKRLVAFLPQFEADEGDYGGADYPPYVCEFMNAYYDEEIGFTDKSYAQKGIPDLEAKLKDDYYIKKASVNQCKTLLTLIMRGDHFCEGYLGACIRDGRIQSVLKRLSELERRINHVGSSS